MKKTLFLSVFLALSILFQPAVLAVDGTVDPGPADQESNKGTIAIHESDRNPDFPWPGLEDPSALITGTEESDDTLDATAVLLYDRATDTMVYGRNIDETRYPASLTKIMTCLLAMERSSLYAEVPVTSSALADMDPDGSTAGLKAGEVYTMEQLLYCLMVKSANDAALVIAEYVGGSVENFVNLMNDRAAELGCTGTHFVNPHGMHDDNHYSTARDLAKIAMTALSFDLFTTLWSTPYYTLPETETRPEQIFASTNYLISSHLTDQYLDDRVTGGKTGFTTPAGRCVICTADTWYHNYLAIVLGASGTDGNGNVIYGAFTTVSRLLDLFAYFNQEKYLEYLASITESEDTLTVWTLALPWTGAILSRVQYQNERTFFQYLDPLPDLTKPVISLKTQRTKY